MTTADLDAVAEAVDCLARCRDNAITVLHVCRSKHIYCEESVGAEVAPKEEACIAGCVASKSILFHATPASSVVAAHACVFAHGKPVRCRYATSAASFALPCCDEDRAVRPGAVCPAYGECIR